MFHIRSLFPYWFSFSA